MTVAVDANGADLGAAEVAAGAAMAAARGTRVLLFGPAPQMGPPSDGVRVVDAPVSVAKAPDAAAAVRAAPDASIVQAARAVAAGEADALVSGGSTGAALAAGVSIVKRARGIHRPALAVVVPVPGAPTLMLDVGASVEARPELLVQYAFMGAAMASAVLGVERPRVALLSNGEEDTKGTADVIEAHARLRERAPALAGIDFVGNVEGTQVTAGVADVIVTDGFTGNVALKVVEGVSATVLRAIRDIAGSAHRFRLGGLLLRPGLLRFRQSIDPEQLGGAFMLGLRRVGVVAHGRFGATGFAQAIAVAERAVREGTVDRTHAALEAAGALRAPPPAAGPPVSEAAASVSGPP